MRSLNCRSPLFLSPQKVRDALKQEFPSYDVVEFFGNDNILTQLQTFATASIIVAPHGVGLSNMVVAPLHTPVFEIAPLECSFSLRQPRRKGEMHSLRQFRFFRGDGYYCSCCRQSSIIICFLCGLRFFFLYCRQQNAITDKQPSKQTSK